MFAGLTEIPQRQPTRRTRTPLRSCETSKSRRHARTKRKCPSAVCAKPRLAQGACNGARSGDPVAVVVDPTGGPFRCSVVACAATRPPVRRQPRTDAERIGGRKLAALLARCAPLCVHRMSSASRRAGALPISELERMRRGAHLTGAPEHPTGSDHHEHQAGNHQRRRHRDRCARARWSRRRERRRSLERHRQRARLCHCWPRLRQLRLPDSRRQQHRRTGASATGHEHTRTSH